MTLSHSLGTAAYVVTLSADNTQQRAVGKAANTTTLTAGTGYATGHVLDVTITLP